MFEDIDINNYNIDFELERSYFLRDCLYEEISYKLKESNVIIYKKLNSGISAEISLDELIYYIHTELADELTDAYVQYKRLPGPDPSRITSKYIFRNLFRKLQYAKNTPLFTFRQ